MTRALFSKTGQAVYISHLDLMRVFQRAFQRAGLPLTHGQGFNQRPFVSIALPMSLGMESACELLSFQLEGEPVPPEEIRRRLNEKLIRGVRVERVYEGGRKLKELTRLGCRLTLEYDRGIPAGAEDEIRALFGADTLPVTKKGKSGEQEIDILPLCRLESIRRETEQELVLQATVCCQNPSLNPMLIPAAIARQAPRLAPDFVRCRRETLYAQDGKIFE